MHARYLNSRPELNGNKQMKTITSIIYLAFALFAFACFAFLPVARAQLSPSPLADANDGDTIDANDGDTIDATGSDRTFTTLSLTGPPVANTIHATNVASFSARLNGSVDPHGLTTNVYFQYGTTTSYGLTTAIQSKTGNAVNHNAAANIIGLTANTAYHFRIVATNSSGTRYGSDRTFTTLSLT
jgi:hypothetical protein